MKYIAVDALSPAVKVALFTRAWIEIAFSARAIALRSVALFTRAWIEIINLLFIIKILSVALFTRAWIEMGLSVSRLNRRLSSRPLHEGVD